MQWLLMLNSFSLWMACSTYMRTFTLFDVSWTSFLPFGCLPLLFEVYSKSIALMPDQFWFCILCLPWLGQKTPKDQGILNSWQYECLKFSYNRLGKPKKLPHLEWYISKALFYNDVYSHSINMLEHLMNLANK